MQKKYLFKSYIEGKSKKTGNDFKILTLHDTATLENVDHFISNPELVPIIKTLAFKDQVLVTHGLAVQYGKNQIVVEDIKKL